MELLGDMLVHSAVHIPATHHALLVVDAACNL